MALTPDEIHTILLDDHHRRLADYYRHRLKTLESAIESLCDVRLFWDGEQSGYRVAYLGK
jgi:hypothetical protein